MTKFIYIYLIFFLNIFRNLVELYALIGKWMNMKLPPSRPGLVTDTIDGPAGQTGNVNPPHSSDHNEFMICRYHYFYYSLSIKLVLIYCIDYYYYYYYSQLKLNRNNTFHQYLGPQ